MIIDAKVRELVHALEQPPEVQNNWKNTSQKNAFLLTLIQTLHINCLKDQAAYPQTKNLLSPRFPQYPMDSEGFAQGFDPMEDERDFRAAFDEYGIVVGKRVISPQLQQKAVLRLHEILSNVSQQKCDFNKPESWANMPRDAHATPLLSRGFFEVYHDALWADIRQSLRLYIHHVV